MRWLVIIPMLVATACTDGLIFEIADSTQTLEDVMMPGFDGWSITGGSLSLSQTGSHHYPAPMALRMRVYERCGHDDGDKCERDLADASVKVAAGSPCRVTIPMSCEGPLCFGEVEVTGLGNCLVQATATTADGHTESACWYKAQYEADDPYDQARLDSLDAKTERELDDCRDEL